jgi:hypothetical protein
MQTQGEDRPIDKGRSPLVMRLWLLGRIVELANAYVSEGDLRYLKRLAPARAWWRAILRPLVGSALACAVVFVPTVYLSTPASPTPTWTPMSVAAGIFPSLLGFGIGVYALLWSLSERWLTEFQTRAAKKAAERSPNDLTRPTPSVLGLSAEFAFPLSSMLVALVMALGWTAVAHITSLTQDPVLRAITLVAEFVAWTAIIFAIQMVARLILTLHRLGMQILLDKTGRKRT